MGLSEQDIAQLGSKIQDIRDTLGDIPRDEIGTKTSAAGGPDLDHLTQNMVQRLIGDESPVRVWREHRGLGLRGLARRSGLAASYIADIENGRKTGSVSALKKLAHALDVDVGDLI